MQIWTFSKHHIFKYDFWEKTRYSNMNFWCFLVTPVSISSLLLPIICFGGRKGFVLGGRAGTIAKWESDLLVKRVCVWEGERGGGEPW